MKQVFTLFLVVFTLSVIANPVDKNQAEQIAKNLLARHSPFSSRSVEIADIQSQIQDGIVTYYTIKFESGGFVIVSADDATVPVLAYSFDQEANNEVINPAAKAWLDNYSKEILEIRSARITNSSTRPLWDDILNNRYSTAERESADVAPLVKTKWDQGCYFNELCPSDPTSDVCGKMWTGCVATTMAQLMKYHSWPEKGIGSHSYNHSKYGVQNANFEATTYNFSSMPNIVSQSNLAIATLMYHAGVSVTMNYDIEGSGAFSADVPFALVNYFNYAPTCRMELKANYTSLNDWYAILRSDLDAGRPIYYAGSSTESGGHAWILDGYKTSDNTFHFNWGWNGNYNGYFLIGSLNPGSHDFNDDNVAIIGITPGNNKTTWKEQNANFAEVGRGINFMHAVNEAVAWASAYDGSGDKNTISEFTRTINGGETWTSGKVLAGNVYGIGNICGINDLVAYVTIYNSQGAQDNNCGIYKTIDGGLTWKQLPGALQGPESFANNVHFWNEQEGMCHGDVRGGYFEIYTTLNGGQTWQRVPSANITGGTALSSEGGWTSVIRAIGPNTIMFGSNKGKLYISDDRGKHWRVSTTGIKPTEGGGINHIAFTDPQNGIVVQTATTIEVKSTYDGGETWNTITPTGVFLTNHIMAIPGSKGIYVSTGAAENATGASYSVDGGIKWIPFPGTEYKQFLAGDFFSNSCGYISGFSRENNNSGIFRLVGTLENAVIFFNPGVIDKTATTEEPLTVSVDIYNNGTTPLQWTLSFKDNPSWVSCNIKEGIIETASVKSITLTLNPAEIENGKYKSSLLINSGTSSMDLPITFNVQKVLRQYEGLYIYPNPVKERLTVEAKNRIHGITLYNTSGKILYQSTLNSKKVAFNVSHITPGIYILRARTEDGIFSTKVIIK